MSVCKTATVHSAVAPIATVVAKRAGRIRAARAIRTRQATHLIAQDSQLVGAQLGAPMQVSLVRLVAGRGSVDVALVAEILTLRLDAVMEGLLGHLVVLGQLDVHALVVAVQRNEGFGLLLGRRDVDGLVGRRRHAALAHRDPRRRRVGAAGRRGGAVRGRGLRWGRRGERAGEAGQLGDARSPRGHGGGCGRRDLAIVGTIRRRISGRVYSRRGGREVLGAEDAGKLGHSEA